MVEIDVERRAAEVTLFKLSRLIDLVRDGRFVSPDEGLARLRSAATGYGSLDELLDSLLKVLTPDGGHDDTAILAVRWHS